MRVSTGEILHSTRARLLEIVDQIDEVLVGLGYMPDEPNEPSGNPSMDLLVQQAVTQREVLVGLAEILDESLTLRVP
jgi:hypothetical protein